MTTETDTMWAAASQSIANLATEDVKARWGWSWVAGKMHLCIKSGDKHAACDKVKKAVTPATLKEMLDMPELVCQECAEERRELFRRAKEKRGRGLQMSLISIE